MTSTIKARLAPLFAYGARLYLHSHPGWANAFASAVNLLPATRVLIIATDKSRAEDLLSKKLRGHVVDYHVPSELSAAAPTEVDAVLTSPCLHELERSARLLTLKALANRLKPGGRLFITALGVPKRPSERMLLRSAPRHMSIVDEPLHDTELAADLRETGFANPSLLASLSLTVARVMLIGTKVPRDRDRGLSRPRSPVPEKKRRHRS